MSDLLGIGYGATFQIGDGASPEVFTTVANLASITPPSLTRSEVEVTNLQSPSLYREFVSGMKDPGEVSLKLKVTGTNLDAVMTEFNKSVDTNYRINGNTVLNRKWDFAGRFMSVTPGELNVDGILEVDCTIRITGAPTISALT